MIRPQRLAPGQNPQVATFGVDESVLDLETFGVSIEVSVELVADALDIVRVNTTPPILRRQPKHLI